MRALIFIQPPGNTLFIHYKVGNYDTIFLKIFYQFLKWFHPYETIEQVVQPTGNEEHAKRC
jgi:hypothetical protein